MDFTERYGFEEQETHIDEIISEIHRDDKNSPFRNFYRQAFMTAEKHRGERMPGSAESYTKAISLMAITAANSLGYRETDTAKAAQMLLNIYMKHVTVEELSSDYMYPDRIEDVMRSADTQLSAQEVVRILYPVLKRMNELDGEIRSKSN